MQRAGAAYAGAILGPVWVDHTSHTTPQIELAIVKLDQNQQPLPFFKPEEVFDVLEVVQILTHELSVSHSVEQELRQRLGGLSQALLKLNQDLAQPDGHHRKSGRIA